MGAGTGTCCCDEGILCSSYTIFWAVCDDTILQPDLSHLSVFLTWPAGAYPCNTLPTEFYDLTGYPIATGSSGSATIEVEWSIPTSTSGTLGNKAWMKKMTIIDGSITVVVTKVGTVVDGVDFLVSGCPCLPGITITRQTAYPPNIYYPLNIDVTIAGMANNSFACCTDINGTYTLTRGASPWNTCGHDYIPTFTCPPGGPLSPTIQYFGGSLTVTAKITLTFSGIESLGFEESAPMNRTWVLLADDTGPLCDHSSATLSAGPFYV